MSVRIFKFPVEGGMISTPPIIKVIEADFQPNFEADSINLCIWAIVVPEGAVTDRRVEVLATGQEVPDEVMEHFDHIKTVQTVEPRMADDGSVIPKSIISHVFLERVGSLN